MKPVRSAMYFPHDVWNRGNDGNLKATSCMHGSQDNGMCKMTNKWQNEEVFAMILEKTQAPPVRFFTHRIPFPARSELEFDCPPEFTATKQWMQFASSPTSGKATPPGVLIKPPKDNKQNCFVMMDSKKCIVMNACQKMVMSIESLRSKQLNKGNCGVNILRTYGMTLPEKKFMEQHLARCVKVYRNTKNFVVGETGTICEVKNICDDTPHLWGPKCAAQAVTDEDVCNFFKGKTVGKGIDPCLRV